MESAITYEIEVQTQSFFLDEQSSVEEERFAFGYVIKIINHGHLNTQLLSRHWIITDGNSKVIEVKGKGVVGEQPLIKPLESHQYNSWSILETPVGTMEGYYTMRQDNEFDIKVKIPRFTLLVPGAIN